MRRILVCFFVLAAACSTGSGSGSSDSGSGGSGSGDAASDGAAATPPADGASTDAISSEAALVGRTNVHASGNRYLPGSVDLTAAPETVELADAPVWLVPIDDGSLAAVMADGSAFHLGLDGEITPLADADPFVRPLAFRDGDSIVLVPANSGVASDLPDATEVSHDDVRAWFDGATVRVPHGALGDTTESSRLVIARRTVSDPMDDPGEPLVGEALIVVDLDDDPTEPVFEGLSPLLADVDGDGTIDIVTTVSDREVGARLVVFDLDGNRLAESRPVGRANRWRHQIAVAPTGPDGQLEVIEVQTPHLSGDLQFQQFDGDGLTLQRGLAGFGSHVVGSRNLDGAVVFDADGDGALEVVVPPSNQASLSIVEPQAGGERTISIDLAGSTVSSNLALADTDAGVVFAVATDDGTVRIWRANA